MSKITNKIKARRGRNRRGPLVWLGWSRWPWAWSHKGWTIRVDHEHPTCPGCGETECGPDGCKHGQVNGGA